MRRPNPSGKQRLAAALPEPTTEHPDRTGFSVGRRSVNVRKKRNAFAPRSDA
jgi:hypothetical protein